MKLKPVIEHWASFVQQLAEDKYGHAPEIRISGHVNSKFPYIEMPLDYIIPELLKNAVRATIEGHRGTRGKNLPPIYVTLANNEIDFVMECRWDFRFCLKAILISNLYFSYTCLQFALQI